MNGRSSAGAGSTRRPALILVAFACALAGCGLFSPRDPEPPTESRVVYEPQLTPDKVISNLQTALAQRDLSNYMRCFARGTSGPRDLVFVPSANLRTEFTTWNSDMEEAHFRTLAAAGLAGDVPTLSLPGSTWRMQGSDSAEFTSTYIFSFRHTKPSVPVVVRGSLQFFLSSNQSVWSIHRWVDNRTETDSTWSLWKKEF